MAAAAAIHEIINTHCGRQEQETPVTTEHEISSPSPQKSLFETTMI
jgi:hypothetical protein